MVSEMLLRGVVGGWGLPLGNLSRPQFTNFGTVLTPCGLQKKNHTDVRKKNGCSDYAGIFKKKKPKTKLYLFGFKLFV